MITIKIGSLWERPVDGTIILILWIDKNRIVYYWSLKEKLLSPRLNTGVIETFWNPISCWKILKKKFS